MPKTYSVEGVGIIDIQVPQSDAAFIKWKSMLTRCYSAKFQHWEPSYIGCSVCNEWLSLSNFKQWFDENCIEQYHLDKDILFKGNKVYSPETCCFVPQEINKLLNTCRNVRGAYPIGVTKCRSRYKASIMVCGRKISIGTFDTPEEAFSAYKAKKTNKVKELAEKYYKEGKITERVYNALLNYRVEITD